MSSTEEDTVSTSMLAEEDVEYEDSGYTCSYSDIDHYPDDYMDKVGELYQLLIVDLDACDGKWTLFTTAALSFNYENLLHPYPPQFTKDDDTLDIDQLLCVINETPKLSILRQRIVEEDYPGVDPRVVDLLHWVIVKLKEPTLRFVKEKEFSSIMQNVNVNIAVESPTHVFQVCYSQNYKREVVFQERSLVYGTKFAFYGNDPDYFYALICNGFDFDKLTKTTTRNRHTTENEERERQKELDRQRLGMSLGQVHLTSELAISLRQSTPRPCWGASSCGAILRCVGLCEFITRRDYIRSSIGTGGAYIDVVVEIPEIVRPRYIIVFGEKLPPLVPPPEPTPSKWTEENQHLVSFACYFAIFVVFTYITNKRHSGIKEFVAHKITQVCSCFKNLCFGGS